MARKDNDYFSMFIDVAESFCDAAAYLEQNLKAFDPDTLNTTLEQMHIIEHTADMKKHEINKKLAKEFITPLEREDIVALTQEIDNVTDNIEDVLISCYTFHIRSIRPEAVRFAELITESCARLKDVIGELRHFKKSEKIRDNIREVNRIEEEGDALYIQALHDVFVHEQDPVALIAWNNLYNRLEKCLDCCENASDVVESIIMKNS